MSSRPKVYVLYTGGTIGMQGDPLQPMDAKAFSKLLASLPGFGAKHVTLQDANNKSFLIDYHFDSLNPPIDSSNMHPTDWVRIASRILKNYERYQGFVVLHGTDTMAWTSSALSYLLDGLSKPVIVTGSQLPLAQTRNDGLRQIITVIEIAGLSALPEVCVFFDALLLRGNRTVKVNCSEFSGFESPNLAPLATVGISYEYDRNLILPKPKKPRSLEFSANRKRLAEQLSNLMQAVSTFSVVSIILFPGIQPSMLQAIFESTRPAIRGVSLQAFGEGDAPGVKEFLDVLAEANRRGVTIVDNTQCLQGVVNINAYATAAGLKEAGVIGGYDLTPEATLTKLVYLTASGASQKKLKALMQKPMHGDLTPD